MPSIGAVNRRLSFAYSSSIVGSFPSVLTPPLVCYPPPTLTTPYFQEVMTVMFYFYLLGARITNLADMEGTVDTSSRRPCFAKEPSILGPFSPPSPLNWHVTPPLTPLNLVYKCLENYVLVFAYCDPE